MVRHVGGDIGEERADAFVAVHRCEADAGKIEHPVGREHIEHAVDIADGIDRVGIGDQHVLNGEAIFDGAGDGHGGFFLMRERF